MAFSFNLSAQEKSDAEGEKAFNPKEAIFEHLLDGYGWELPFSHEHRIPLPVIVRDYKGDWQVFLSSRLGHGQQYKGFYIAQEGPNKGKVESVDDQGNRYRPLDLSITKNVLALFIAAFVCAWCVLSVARWYKRKRYKAPRKGVGAIEFLIEFIYTGVIKSTLGDKAPRFAPYLLTAFFFILLMNLLGLIVIFPGGANLTGNIAVTMVMALCTFIVVNVRGTKEYWKEIFWPDVPLWLKFPLPIMPLIEVFGIFTKPFALRVAHLHLQRVRCRGGGSDDGGIGVVLALHAVDRHAGIVYSSLCIHHAFDPVHFAGTGRRASRERKSRNKIECIISKQQTLC